MTLKPKDGSVRDKQSILNGASIAEARGLDKLNEIPDLLRDFVNELEFKLRRKDSLAEVNLMITVELRNLMGCLSLLQEDAARALKDRDKILSRYINTL